MIALQHDMHTQLLLARWDICHTGWLIAKVFSEIVRPRLPVQKGVGYVRYIWSGCSFSGNKIIC